MNPNDMLLCCLKNMYFVARLVAVFEPLAVCHVLLLLLLLLLLDQQNDAVVELLSHTAVAVEVEQVVEEGRSQEEASS